MKTLLLIAAITVAAFAQAPVAPQTTGYCRAPQNMVHGRPDNFAPNGPEMPAMVSPALKALIAAKKAPTKGFDDPAQDRWLAGSFQISGCRVCREVVITLNIRRPKGGLADNDAILIGLAPFTAPNLLVNMQPWLNTTVLTKTVTLTIPMAQMNQLIMNQPPGPVWLDYLIQDDTEVDSITVQLIQ